MPDIFFIEIARYAIGIIHLTDTLPLTFLMT